MPLTTVRQGASARFQEAQAFLSAIKALEDPRVQPSTELNVRKGLFLVLLYGAFEYAVTRTLIETTSLINAYKVEHGHVSERLYSLALDPQLTSVAMAGRDRKWQQRAELFRKQVCADPVVLQEGALLPQMENVWAATIESLFEIFGVSGAPLYDVRVRQYINEVVDKRNALAHGRESAAATGQAYTTGGLQKLLDELTTQAQHIFSAFEGHITTKNFVKAGHQARY